MAKTKTLISFAVTAKLICAFVFAYAKCWFSHVPYRVALSIITQLLLFYLQLLQHTMKTITLITLLCVTLTVAIAAPTTTPGKTNYKLKHNHVLYSNILSMKCPIQLHFAYFCSNIFYGYPPFIYTPDLHYILFTGKIYSLV